MALVRAALAAAWLLTAALVPARADDVPEIGFGPIYYFSTDTSPVRVKLTHDVATGASFPDLVVPRAYVIFVNAPRPNPKAPVPDNVETNHIDLAFVDGTGEPWSVAVLERARRDGMSRRSSGELLRPQLTTISLGPSTNKDFVKHAREGILRSFKRQEDEFEGLPHYRMHYPEGPAGNSYYIGSSEDEFVTAICQGQLHPVYLCSYRIVVTSGVIANVTFVDFRLHGGRDFANRRLRFARETACHFLTRC